MSGTAKKQTKATLSSKGWRSGIGSSEVLKDQDQEKFKSEEGKGADGSMIHKANGGKLCCNFFYNGFGRIYAIRYEGQIE